MLVLTCSRPPLTVNPLTVTLLGKVRVSAVRVPLTFKPPEMDTAVPAAWGIVRRAPPAAEVLNITPPLTELRIKLFATPDTVDVLEIKTPPSAVTALIAKRPPEALVPEIVSDPPEIFWPGALIPPSAVMTCPDMLPVAVRFPDTVVAVFKRIAPLTELRIKLLVPPESVLVA